MNPDEQAPSIFALSCPMPINRHEHVLLAHGGGGRMTQELIDSMFGPAFANPALDARHDGAVLEAGGARFAFTTDGYVVKPLFFPGGDIGTLAVNGTVNDLAMCGARPLVISAGFIIEEGFPMAALARVVDSMAGAVREAGVQLVTGDTKVVERGGADELFITTAGVGLVEHGGATIGPAALRAGDVILLSGDVGRHGMTIMAQREGLAFESPITSDCAPVVAPVMAMLAEGIDVHCLRDLTRGGLATALCELAAASRLSIELDEVSVHVEEAVKGACELLGFDPLYVANEGRFIAIVPESDAERALEIMRRFDVAAGATRAGRVKAEGLAGAAVLRSRIGAGRVLDLLSGEQLPRIC